MNPVVHVGMPKELIMFRRQVVPRAWVWAVVGAAVLVAACSSNPRPAQHSAAMPAAVAKTFKAAFPRGEPTKVDAEEENGVMVYNVQFKDGMVEKETDIAADGTMLEFTDVIAAKDVPTPAMAAIRKAAVGADIGRIERATVSYETKDGKVVKLAQPVTHYEVELAKGGKRADLVVNPDGTIVAAPQWSNR